MSSDTAKTILLVEDEAIIALSEAMMLKKYGYQVITVSSGEAAVETVQSSPDIHLVLMDIDLGGGMDGTEAAALILQQRDLPLIFLSSHTEQDVVNKTEAITSYGYIVKNSGETVIIASIKMAFRLFESLSREKMKERALHEGRNRFHTATENMLDAFGIYSAIRDPTGKIVDFRIEYANPVACLVNKMTQGEQVGKRLLEVLPAHIESGLFDEYCELVETGQPLIKESLDYTDVFGEQLLFKAFDIRAVKQDDGFIAIWREITERKRAEEDLRSKNKQLAEITSRLPCLVFQFVAGWDGSRTVSSVNGQVEKMLDLDPDPQDFFERFTAAVLADQRSDFINIVENTIREVTDWKYEGAIAKPSGETVWISGIASPTKTSEGIVYDGVIVDITERKQAEEALRHSESLLRNLVDTIPDLIWMKDTEGLYLGCNPNFERFFGAKEADIIGRTDHDFVDADLADFFRENDKKAIATGGPVSNEEILTYADTGHSGLFETVKAPMYDADGQLFGVLGIARDITERKKAEEVLFEGRAKLKGALESMTDAVFISDVNGNFVDFNEAFSMFHRLQSKKECLSALADWPSFLGVYSDDGKQLPLDMWVVSRALRGEQGVNEVFKLQRRDTGETWFGSYNFAPIYNNEGYITGSVVVAHYITEKLQIQAKLAQVQKLEAIGTLAGGIAHDFNNILGAILGYAEMVQDDCLTGSTMRNYIDHVVEASHRAKELVKQILAFSRQAEITEQALQPAFIIKEAVKMLRASLPTTIEIQINIDPEVGLILADPTRIHQIMTNLCTNAFHAMEETGGTLTISLKNKEFVPADLIHEPHVQPGHFVEISVGDTGPGISPQIINKIFDPFFTTKEVGKGTGMGLAIIHGIAKKSGGFVSCRSSPDEGTIFHVYLPIHVSTAHPKEKITPLELIQTGIERILFVDDEEMLAEMGKNMLERLGYRVTIETNSIEALKTIQNQPDRFDLVITDQTMPGMTGSDLARRIMQMRPGMPIILCTGFSNMISEEKARIYGIKGFAMKPLAKKDLAALIRKVLDREK